MLCLDSGAYSIWNESYKKGTILSDADLRKYMDEYAAFVKENIATLTLYINVDLPFSPSKTYENQKYLEKEHGLSPLPVVHPGENISWLKKYVDEGYPYVGIGCMGASTVGKQTWIKATGDPFFNFICDTPNKLPRIKTHAFAAASPEIFVKYPWFSVDSASWVIYGKYGGIIIPKKTKGKYDYSIAPYLIKTSWKNHHINIQGTHIDNITGIQRNEFLDYFEMHGLKLGISEFKKVSQGYELQENETWVSSKKKDEVEIIFEKGLCNDYRIRDDANLYYFLDMEKQIPEYPWAYYNKTRRLF